MTLTVAPSARVRGVVRVPGDKSGSHRALMLAALAAGESPIEGLSPGEDVVATAEALVAMGARVVRGARRVVVHGPARGLRPAPAPLECANSGTSMRLLAGVVAGVDGEHTLVGDASLSRRPMDRVATPLSLMGARVTGHGPHQRAPLTVVGATGLRAIDYSVPVPSAQVKSAILLAGLAATGHVVVRETTRTRATTEVMLSRAGVTVHSVDEGPGRVVTLTPGRPAAREWRVSADPSQAAFFAVAALLAREGGVVVPDLDDAPERVGFVAVLARMGGRVSLEEGESGATLSAASSELVGAVVRASEIPALDEVPVLAVAAAAASGETRFVGVGELRVKESDRLEGTRALVQSLGAAARVEGDDLVVEGVGSASRFTAFRLDAGFDHRMAMAGAVAAVCGAGGEIVGGETVATSYPGFFGDLAALT
ncbi:MAG TPA: 3-phosphoshikimate 1-carboxyvinyltransferase [Acidimicrobiales bacterium]|nr:3-phosphoshikimate 1-carboxyvinyltransferase [Acidimicrobiales bacterium]